MIDAARPYAASRHLTPRNSVTNSATTGLKIRRSNCCTWSDLHQSAVQCELFLFSDGERPYL